MNNMGLASGMKAYEVAMLLKGVKPFGGVLAIDQLRHLKRKKMYVVNTKPSDHPGEHWIVIDWMNRRPYMFDSFAQAPKYYGLPKMNYWKRQLQQFDSDTCGAYCVYYIVHRSRRHSPEYMFKDYGKNRKRNDRRIVEWLKWRLRHL